MTAEARLARPWPAQFLKPAPARLYAPALAVVCLLAAVLRLHTLDAANPWWDEGFTYWLASQDVHGMLLRTAGDTHPPLSYLLYQAWLPLAGASLYALRFQAALFGVLAIPVCATAARRLAGPGAGLLAGLLLAISPFHVWWSQQIRMYALVALLCALSICCLTRALSGDRRGWLGLAAANLAGLYTLYFFAVLVALEGALVLARRRELRRAVPALAAGPLLLLPWLAYYRQHAIRFANPPAPPIGWQAFAGASWAELTLGIDTGWQRYIPLLLALGLAALALAVPLPSRWERLGEGARRSSGMRLWLALVAAGLPLAAYGVTLLHGLFFSPVYQTRYDLPAVPALVILLALGLSRVPRPAALAALALFAGAAVFGLGSLYDARHRTDDYQSLARFVQAYERPGDAIVFDPDTNFHLFLLDYRGQLPWEAIPAGQAVDAAYADQLFSRWTAQHQALWLLQEAGGHDAGAQRPVRGWLQAHLRPSLRLAVGDRLLVLYEPAGAAPRTLNTAFAPERQTAGIGFDQPLDDVRPGDVLQLAVYNQAVQALDFAGRRLLPRATPGRAGFAIPIPAGTPAGQQPIAAELTGGQTVPLSSVYVEARPAPPAADLPPLPHPAGQTFGGQALLTSYALTPEAPNPGQALTVELQWRALAPFVRNETVFVHLLDGQSHVVAQRDAQPQDGALPTVRWQPGQTLDDAYVLQLPASLPPGAYQLEVGMYLQSTGERLPVDGGQDRVLLAPVQVRAG